MQENDLMQFEFIKEKLKYYSELTNIISFISDIAQEMKFLISIEYKFELISYDHDKLLRLCKKQAEILINNNINYKTNLPVYNLYYSGKNTKYTEPTRSMLILLFSNIEVIFCFHIAYEFETTNHTKIIGKTSNIKEIYQFLNTFYLTPKNEYYNENNVKFAMLSPKKIRNSRNSLVHFFSTINTILLFQSANNQGAENLKNKFRNVRIIDISFFSPKDLLESIKYTFSLLFAKWDYDSKNTPQEFTIKIRFVKKFIHEKSSLIVNADTF